MADQPAVVLSYDPPGPIFAISSQAEMPSISVTAAFQNITPDPKIPLQFQWSVTVAFNGNALHALGRKIFHPAIKQVTDKNTFKIPFTAVRGGDLTITLSVVVGTTILTATSKGLTIIGKDPSPHELSLVASPITAFRKLMRIESGLRQFISGGPYFSEDDRGGAGLCQVTDPSPTDDEVWNWKANVAAGLRVYKGKEAIAGAHPRLYRKSDDFKDLVKSYNDSRYQKAVATAAAAKPPVAAKEVPRKDLTITIPDYTSDQLELATIRLYNGAADHLHEFIPKVDKDGLLVVTVDEPNLKGTTEWQQVTADQRRQQYTADKLPEKNWGDPAYVDDVLRQASF